MAGRSASPASAASASPSARCERGDLALGAGAPRCPALALGTRQLPPLLRARCSRSRRDELGLGAPGSARARSSARCCACAPPVGLQRPPARDVDRRLGLGERSCASTRSSPARAFASATAASRLSVSRACRSICGQRPRASAASAPASRATVWRSWRSARSAAARAAAASAGGGARGLGLGARSRLAPLHLDEPVALAQPLRRGAISPCAAATKPSQRQRSPSRLTRRWPAWRSGCSAARLGAARRRSAAGGAPAPAARRPRGRAARRRAAAANRAGRPFDRQCTGASGASGASRSSPSAAPSATS